MCRLLCHLGCLELWQLKGLQLAKKRWGAIGWLGLGDGVSMIIPKEEEGEGSFGGTWFKSQRMWGSLAVWLATVWMGGGGGCCPDLD